MAAALSATPGGEFPAGCILSITGAEDLDITAADDSKVALHEFARRLDLRRDQFLPAGGIVLVWATARVFDALAEHALNFISRAAAVLSLAAAWDRVSVTVQGEQPANLGDLLQKYYHIPPLPSDAPEELAEALASFDEFAAANQLYREGGAKTAHALAAYDGLRERIEAGWENTRRLAALDEMEGAAKSATNTNPIRDFARALLAAYPGAGAHILSLRQNPHERIVWLDAQFRAAKAIGDKQGQGNALGNLGVAYSQLGEMRKAIGYYEQRLAIAREIGDRLGEGNGFAYLGNAYRELGEPNKAIGYLEQSLAAAQETGHRENEGKSLNNLGLAYLDLGDSNKAISHFEKRLDIAREIGERRGEAAALGNLGIVHKKLGDVRKGIEFYERQLGIVREIGDRRGESNALGNLGNAHKNLGDGQKALEYFEQALVIDREDSDPRGEGRDLWNSALVFEQMGNRPEAVVRGAEALRILEDIEDPNAAKVRARLAEWRAT